MKVRVPAGSHLSWRRRASNRYHLGIRSVLLAAALALSIAPGVFEAADRPIVVTLPTLPDATRFAVIGDGGTGGRAQYEVAEAMEAAHAVFPFGFVLMAGDNLYGGEGPDDFSRKFEQPYADLLSGGVQFFACLGNHDSANQRFYRNFNMKGERYYTFKQGKVRFFALDSTYMNPAQLEWVEKQLRDSSEPWKICFFHHPLYSSAKRHGSDVTLRKVLEPLFIRYGVSAVFSGHDHIYERIRPQHGITYFVTGAAGQLRRDNIRPGDLTAKGFAADRHFMLVEVAADTLYFQAISRTGETVDSGSIAKAPPGVEQTEDSRRE